jgi:hypothetical protein
VQVTQVGAELAFVLADSIERACNGERLCNAVRRGLIAYEDVHLVELSAEKDVRNGASPREALKEVSMNGDQVLQRRAPWFWRSSARRRDRLPTDDHDHRAGCGNAVGGH